MSVKTTVKFDSKIFNSAELKRALSKLPLAEAKKFVAGLQEKMDSSPHTGKVVTKVRGKEFRIRHQQSKRGERPAPFSRVLINSLKAKSTGEYSAQLNSDAEYADKLIFEDGRVIVSDQDLSDARKSLQSEVNAVIRSFL